MSTQATLVRRLRRHAPKDISEALRTCGITVSFLGGGGYRDVYAVEGLPVVLKVPLSDEYVDKEDTIEHAQNEYKVYSEVMRNPKYRRVRKYMPRFFDFNSKTGVALVERYEKLDKKPTSVKRFNQAIKDLYDVLQPREGFDECIWNFGRDAAGNIRIIDMGLVEDLK